MIANCADAPFDSSEPSLATERSALIGVAPPYLVTELDSTPLLSSSNPQDFTPTGTVTYFSADLPASGRELWKTDGTVSGTVLVSDINPGLSGSLPDYLTPLNGILYFTANDGTHGEELWRTDGTELGTWMVSDINPGSATSSIDDVVVLNGKLYFAADNGTHGVELWVSDGTKAGTAMVADINPNGTAGIDELVVMGSNLYFNADDDGATGEELWTSNGTVGNATLVLDILVGATNGAPSQLTVVGGNTLFFAATNGTGTGMNGRELWKTDGTAAGTVLVKDIRAGTTSSTPEDFYDWNGTLLFSALTAGTSDRELWKSDGTTAGTVLVKDIRSGTSGGSPQLFTAVNNVVVFSATDGTSTGQGGTEVYVTDGTTAGTVRLRDINAGTASSSPGDFLAFNNKVYFSASSGTTTGVGAGDELWVTDGTAAGTVLLKDINPGTSGSAPNGLVLVNGEIWFEANDGASGNEIWKTDGTTAGTTLKLDVDPVGDSDSFVTWLTPVGNTLLFTAQDDTHGDEPFVTTGSIAGTRLLEDMLAGASSSSPSWYTILGSNVFFEANNGASTGQNGTELFSWDGTPTGTPQLVKDIFAGTSGSAPSDFAVANGTLFFAASTGSSGTGTELWKSDGTAAGTVLVKDILVGASSSFPGQLTPFAGKIFFEASDGTSTGQFGTELWMSDGTAAGTQLVLDIKAGTSSSSPTQLTVVGNKLFFIANGAAGAELWVTDGTTAGTQMVIDMNQGTGGGGVDSLVDFNGTLYFTASDSVTGMTALWKTDGTSAGTLLVADIQPGGDPVIRNMKVIGSSLFFSADDGVNGTELWVTDGTTAGTVMVKDIFPGQRGSYPNGLWSHGGKLLFSASDGVNGFELWESDGTAAGTVLVSDLNPGPASSNPGVGVQAGDYLYFPAFVAPKGRELFAIALVTPPDLVKPTISCPAPMAITTHSASGTAVTFTVSATDDVTSAPTITTNLASGSTFAPGTTVVNATATDAWGNASTCSFNVVVTYVDNTPPLLTCPANQAATAGDPSGTNVTYPAATASDDSGVPPTVTYSQASGTVFPVGTTAVTVTATDTGNNTATCTFDVVVTIVDTTAPEITCPAAQTASTSNTGGVAVTFPVATATDNSGVAPTIGYSHASGSVFPIGTTTVTATATDGQNNASTCTFAVTVTYLDDVPPTVTCPGNQAVTTEDPSGTTVTYPAATASDNVTASPALSYSKPSGDSFVVGNTTVTVTATDDANNTQTCTFEVAVTLIDLTAPVITCPANVTTTTNASPGNVVTYAAATATDNLTAMPMITYSKASGSVFELGETTVTATATDEANNTATCTFTVTLTDDTAPVITCPSNVNAQTSVATDRKVTFAPATATDNVTALPAITYSQTSGSVFEVGETTVTATAKDEANNEASCNFTVLLADDVAPAVTCPSPVAVETASAEDSDAVVEFGEATSTDDVTATPEITWSAASGTRFPVGETTVTATAKDTAGNDATCSFTVTVTQKPAEEPNEEPGGCGCGAASNAVNPSFALLGILGLAIVAGRRRRAA